MIAIVDYGMGNRRSVEKALERVGAQPRLTADHAVLLEADGLVVPGVGAFPEAMRRLRDAGLDEVIRERADAVPVLGLCLGMQLLCAGSEEFEDTEGLDLLGGWVRRLEPAGLKLPHIGWHEVEFVRSTPLTGSAGGREAYYHVHSYAPERTEDTVAVGDYGGEFVSIAARGNVFGCQFHPEKSSHAGLALLREFTRLCAPVPA